MNKSFSPSTRFTLFFLFLFFLFSNSLHAAELTFAWSPNTEPNLAGYKIYYGTASRIYSMAIDVGNPVIIDGKVTCPLTVLPQENTLYYFTATAYDGNGFESDYSTEVVVDVSADVSTTEAVFMFLTNGFPQEDISAVEETGLLKVWQIQKLSRDLYQSFSTVWASPIYANMLSDTQHHMDFVHILLGKFGIPVPQDLAGIFTDQVTQNLFNLMLNTGNGSAIEALKLAATAEDMIIDELQILLPQTANLEIQIIYQNLLKSARNHLRLFVNELSKAGISYDPQYISGDDYTAIIAAPIEAVIYDENGGIIYENNEWLVTATQNGPNQIDLTWMDSTPLIDAATLGDPANKIVFQVTRSINGGAYTLLVEVPADATGCSDTTVVAGNTYEYRVFVVNETSASSIGFYSNGVWNLDMNGNGIWDGAPTDKKFANFGGVTSIPVTGDWNNDGVTEIGIYSNGIWYLDMNGNGIWDGVPIDKKFASFGGATYKPVTGDWNNDGVTDLGIYCNGTWYLDMNGNGNWDGAPTDKKIASFGGDTYLPVTGDWDSDGVTEIGLYRNGEWYLDMNGNGIWDGAPTDKFANFGGEAYIPIVGNR